MIKKELHSKAGSGALCHGAITLLLLGLILATGMTLPAILLAFEAFLFGICFTYWAYSD